MQAMKRKAVYPLRLRTLAVVCVIALLMPIYAIGQQPDPSVQQLKEQIKSLEAIDKDPGTTNEARALNKKFLEDRKQRLQVLLIKEIAGLQDYQRSVGQHLSAEESRRIENTIQELQSELVKLRGESAAITATREAAVEPGPLVRTPEVNAASPEPSRVTLGRTVTASPTPSASGANEVTLANGPFQSVCYPNAPQRLTNVVRAAAQQFLRGDDPQSQFGEASFFAITHAVAVKAGREDLFQKIEIKQLQEQTKRTDKQIGATARAEGSTSATEKPNFAELLGFAIENGAVQQSVSGTTLSLSTTPYALFAAFNGDTPSTYKEFGYLSRVGVSANFLIENQENVLASARRKQLTGWSIRARLTPDRSTRSDEVAQIWASISDEFARPNLEVTRMLMETFGTDPVLEAKRREIADRFVGIFAEPAVVNIRSDTTLTADQKIARIGEKLLCQIKQDIVDQVETGDFKLDQATKSRIINVTLPAYAAALKAKDDALAQFDKRVQELSLKPQLTFSYDNIRPANQTIYSSLNLLFEKKTGPLTAVANAGLSLYHRPNATLRQETVRDFAVALSFEGRAGRSPFLIEDDDLAQITYAFSGRYQRMLENRFIPGRKTDIAVAQFKFNLPVFAAVSLPFSVTYANATELIKEDHIRANFGFSFDADKLLKVIKLAGMPNP